MKPDCRLFNTLRTLGVLFSTSSPSAVKACTGMFSQASKSSGAARFFPITISDCKVSASGTTRLSGVRALNTGVMALLLSGVLGLGKEDGPKVTRVSDLRVDSDEVSVGDRADEGVAVTVAEHGRDTGTGTF